jgi:acyl-[acyl carrier protein]--UDP-N-acetylglucosamine O-acyltransferase
VIKVSAPFDSIRGVNTLEELFIIEQIKRKELMHYWMDKGVRFLTDYNIHIDVDVTIGHDSCIEGNVYLKGKTSIGDNVYIHPFSIINNSTIQSQSYVGPFTYIKNNILIPTPAMAHKTVSAPKYNKQTSLHPTQQRHEEENGFSFTGARLVHHDILTEEQ